MRKTEADWFKGYTLVHKEESSFTKTKEYTDKHTVSKCGEPVTSSQTTRSRKWEFVNCPICLIKRNKKPTANDVIAFYANLKTWEARPRGHGSDTRVYTKSLAFMDFGEVARKFLGLSEVGRPREYE